MIYWVSTRRHEYPIRSHLASFGRWLADVVTPLSYGRLFHQRRPAGGMYILSDVERLGERAIQQASRLCDRLRECGSSVLNRPADCLRRYELLRDLHTSGTNAFGVYRVRDEPSPERFPVFLRLENDHKGSRSALLADEAALKAAVAEQCRTRFWFRDEHGKRRLVRLGGRRRRGLLVTEFCDTADANGVYRKYAAFNVGGTIIARHLFFGRRWMIKSPDLQEPSQVAEEYEYVRSNPHAAQLAELFRMAHIDYGRIDYALLDGRIQVWEINTNPMICSTYDEQWPTRLPVQTLFAERFANTLRRLDELSKSAVSGGIAAAA